MIKATHSPGGQDDLQDIRAIAGMTVVACRTKEEQLLVEVLSNHLGRLIVADDFKDCEMIYRQGESDLYIFKYNGVELGIVQRETKLDNFSEPYFSAGHYKVQYLITFTPAKPVEPSK